MRARDIMTTHTIAVLPTATIDEAAEVMAAHGFTTLPVVDSTGQLVGLLSEADVVRAPRPSGDPDTGVMLDRHDRTVSAAMRTGLGAHPDADVASLARRMAEAGIRSLPVLADGRVIGMVTFQDVLRTLGTG